MDEKFGEKQIKRHPQWMFLKQLLLMSILVIVVKVFIDDYYSVKPFGRITIANIIKKLCYILLFFPIWYIIIKSIIQGFCTNIQPGKWIAVQIEHFAFATKFLKLGMITPVLILSFVLLHDVHETYFNLPRSLFVANNNLETLVDANQNNPRFLYQQN